jgi:hypothetical protein
MELIWPKYLQAFLNEMAVELNCKRYDLSEEEFDEMPESWLDNLENFALFEDYLTSDLQIEVCRAMKYRTCQMLVQKKTNLSDKLDKFAEPTETK